MTTDAEKLAKLRASAKELEADFLKILDAKDKVIAELRTELARVTRERDALRTNVSGLESQLEAYREWSQRKEAAHAEALQAAEFWQNYGEAADKQLAEERARVAELEAEIANARKEWIGDDFGHLPLGQALGALRAKLAAEAGARNALLVARIAMMDKLHNKAMSHSCKCGDSEYCPHCDPSIRLSDLAEQTEKENARAESVEPDKHPDTERLDWLEANRAQIGYTTGAEPHLPHVHTPKTYGESGETIRAAIDAAMKGGEPAKHPNTIRGWNAALAGVMKDTPKCFGSNPGPQTQAENDCIHCKVSEKCAVEPADKWIWKMDYCKRMGFSPASGWKLAEQAWNSEPAKCPECAVEPDKHPDTVRLDVLETMYFQMYRTELNNVVLYSIPIASDAAPVHKSVRSAIDAARKEERK